MAKKRSKNKDPLSLWDTDPTAEGLEKHTMEALQNCAHWLGVSQEEMDKLDKEALGALLEKKIYSLLPDPLLAEMDKAMEDENG